jgi:hypothetical protein
MAKGSCGFATVQVSQAHVKAIMAEEHSIVREANLKSVLVLKMVQIQYFASSFFFLAVGSGIMALSRRSSFGDDPKPSSSDYLQRLHQASSKITSWSGRSLQDQLYERN